MTSMTSIRFSAALCLGSSLLLACDVVVDGSEEQTPRHEACEKVGEQRACALPDGEEGTQFCDGLIRDGIERDEWGECLEFVNCQPGESRSCGNSEQTAGLFETCDLYSGVPHWDSNRDEFAGCNTPLVLSFDGLPARMNAAGAATFDLDGTGGCITTDWPAAQTPWLALDRDGNGSIDSGRELFGSGTRLGSGERAPHGFVALAELDEDGDGRITPLDSRFSELVLWGDHDQDRRSTFAETEPLAHYQILELELGYRVHSQCDGRGNCGVERASFTFIDDHGAVRTGEIVDLHLACQ
ncbi:MAG: calcium-binding protein [Myxococcota bacterium]